MTINIGSSTSYPALAPELTDTADIQAALRLLAYGITTDPGNDSSILVNSVFGKIRWGVQKTHSTITDADTTFTAAKLLSGIINYTKTTATSTNLPAATTITSSLPTVTPVNTSFDWFFINSSNNTFTCSANGTAHLLIGSGVITSGTSAHFRTVKTQSSPSIVYTTYRIS